MKVTDYLNKNIIVKQVKSNSGLDKKQLGCLKGLGLRGISSESSLKCDQDILGMVKKVNHVIQIQEA